MTLLKGLRTRRGGGRVVRGGDACVALAGGGKRSPDPDEGDASVPTSHPRHSRPYEFDDLPPKHNRIRVITKSHKQRKQKHMSKLTSKDRENLPESAFAFPKERKEPLIDARHIQEAIARFDQVENVTNKERDEAWKRIKAAAKKFDVELQENDWRQLFTRNGRSVPRE